MYSLPVNPATGQLPTAEEIRDLLARAATYKALGLAEPAVRLNDRAREFAAQLAPWQDQLCPIAERTLIAYNIPFVSEAAVRDEQRIEIGA